MLSFEHLLTDFAGRGATRRFAEVPESCPLCHHHVDPRRLTAHATTPDGTAVDFAFQCPRGDCRRVFVGRYVLGPDGEFDLLSVSPAAVRPEPIPPEIRALSPAFAEVYGQAREARARGLNQVAALAFRSALETLLADHAEGELAGADRGGTFSARIDACVDDPRIRDFAARAGWLEDDDARGWGPREAEALEVLVRLVVNWLDNVLLARKYSEAAVAA